MAVLFCVETGTKLGAGAAITSCRNYWQSKQQIHEMGISEGPASTPAIAELNKGKQTWDKILQHLSGTDMTLCEFIQNPITCSPQSWGGVWYWGKKRPNQFSLLFCLVLCLVSDEVLIVQLPLWLHPTEKLVGGAELFLVVCFHVLWAIWFLTLQDSLQEEHVGKIL